MSRLADANPEEVAALRKAGYTIDTDDELVAAFADHFRVSEASARAALAGELGDVVTA